MLRALAISFQYALDSATGPGLQDLCCKHGAQPFERVRLDWRYYACIKEAIKHTFVADACTTAPEASALAAAAGARSCSGRNATAGRARPRTLTAHTTLMGQIFGFQRMEVGG